MKKIVSLILAVLMTAALITACAPAEPSKTNDNHGDNASSQPLGDNKDDNADEALKGAITVITREDGSGIRGAFIELLGRV